MNAIEFDHKPQINVSVLDVIFFYYVLLIGSATPLLTNLDVRVNPVGVAMYFTALLSLISFTKLPLLNNGVKIVLSVVLGWFAVHYYIDPDFKYLQHGIYFIHIVTGYFIVRVYGNTILLRFERCVTLLAIISLLMWVVELHEGIPFMQSHAPFKNTWENGGSYLIFNIQPVDYIGAYAGSIIRNSGFAWEPGRFASILVLAYACNVIRMHGKINYFSKRRIIFVCALVTTFSTTGLIALLLVMALNIVFSKEVKPSSKIVLAVVFRIAIAGILKLPYMSEKISTRADESTYMSNDEERLALIEEGDEQFTVDRFEGLMLDGLNLAQTPWVGYGLNAENSYVQQEISQNLVTSNDIVKPMAMFGVPLTLLFFIVCFLGLKRLTREYGYNFGPLLFITLMTISVSYRWMDTPIMFALAYYSVFSYEHDDREHIHIHRNRLLQQ